MAYKCEDKYFITFDLQKTLPLPKLSTSVAFYFWQVWLYNLGIHLTMKREEKAYMQIWTEDELVVEVKKLGAPSSPSLKLHRYKATIW